MNKPEKEKFIFEQTCLLLAGRLGNSKADYLPKQYIAQHFEDTYKALAAEIEKSYISTSIK